MRNKIDAIFKVEPHGRADSKLCPSRQHG